MSEETVEQTQEEAPKPLTGFAVFIGANGSVFIETNPAVLTVPVEKQASLVEVRRACSDVVMDLQAPTAAEYTIIRLKALEQDKA
jgi:hypothetical protein